MKTALAIPIIIAIFIFGNLFSKKNVVNDRVDEVFENITKIDVKGSFVAVKILGSDRTDVQLEGEIRSNRDTDDYSIEYSESDGVLTVWIERPSTVMNVSGFLNFAVPSNIDVKLYNSSGSVNVDNIVSGKTVNVQSSSGSVKVSNIDADLYTKASSGSIKITNVKGNTEVYTSSGSIGVYEVDGNISAQSSSGAQRFENIQGNLTTRSSSGSLKFTSLKGDLNARANSGSIRLEGVKGAINLTTSSGSQLGNNVQLTADSKFKSSSGSITMNVLNQKHELRMLLQSKSGGLTAFDVRGKRNLKTHAGEIIVTGYSNSGSQKYY